MEELRKEEFWGGGIYLFQPLKGYRATIDPIFFPNHRAPMKTQPMLDQDYGACALFNSTHFSELR